MSMLSKLLPMQMFRICRDLEWPSKSDFLCVSQLLPYFRCEWFDTSIVVVFLLNNTGLHAVIRSVSLVYDILLWGHDLFL